jgi:hypothetical protein
MVYLGLDMLPLLRKNQPVSNYTTDISGNSVGCAEYLDKHMSSAISKLYLKKHFNKTAERMVLIILHIYY